MEMVKVRIFSRVLKELLMCSGFHDAAFFEHDNPVRAANSGKTVGNYERSTSGGKALDCYSSYSDRSAGNGSGKYA